MGGILSSDGVLKLLCQDRPLPLTFREENKERRVFTPENYLVHAFIRFDLRVEIKFRGKSQF